MRGTKGVLVAYDLGFWFVILAILCAVYGVYKLIRR